MPGPKAKQNRRGVAERENTPAVRERQGEMFPGEIRVARVSFSGPSPLPAHL